MITFGLIALEIITLAGGQILWKKGIDQAGGFLKPGEPIWISLFNLFTNLTFLIGCVSYGFATLLWFYLLARYELSFVYPFISLTFLVSFIGARFVLGEEISVGRWFAVLLICGGVALMFRT